MKVSTVCIIDDDLIYQVTSKKMIQHVNATNNILIFSNGQEAFHFLLQTVTDTDALPDIIFLDVNMPYMDAWEFLEAYETIKTRLVKEITIYVISSSVSEKDIERAKKIPVVKDYYIKPITIAQYSEILVGV
ncbi:MAG TPA: response regulator [Panacibacter sp.]|nr:response regulator [Panacibacter sp.]